MTLNSFIVDYVSNCRKNKLNPIESAKNEIENIEQKIKETDILYLKRKKLLAVLDYCGHKTLGKNKDELNFNVDQDSESFIEVENKILSLLEENSLTVREIVKNFDYDNDFIIVNAIKNLGTQNKIVKDAETLKFSLNYGQ